MKSEPQQVGLTRQTGAWDRPAVRLRLERHFMLVSEMPHGGVKRSGYGKVLSMYALEDYTTARHVMVKL